MTFIKTVNLSEANSAGRVRTAQQRSQIGYLQSLEKDVTRFDEETNGTATSVYEGNGVGGVNMTVAANLDFVIRKGKEANYYYPGSPQKIELTASNFQNQTGVIKRMGYFSSNLVTPFNTVLDGFTIESDGTEHYCKVYRAGTEIFSLASASWRNQSKVSNWLPTGFGFYVIEFVYLGGLTANFKVAIGGELVTVARYTHLGVDAGTFVKSPNQPVRYEIRSTSGAGEFNHICGDVGSEGTGQIITISRAANNGSSLVASLSAGTRYAMLGIRLKAANLLSVADVYGMSILAGSADDLLVELFIGGSVVTPNFVDKANTIMQVHDISTAAIANSVHSGGISLLDFYVSANNTKDQLLQDSRRLGSLIDGTPEEVYLCVTGISANAGVLASINWKEFI